eukprot:gene3257-13281_t
MADRPKGDDAGDSTQLLTDVAASHMIMRVAKLEGDIKTINARCCGMEEDLRSTHEALKTAEGQLVLMRQAGRRAEQKKDEDIEKMQHQFTVEVDINQDLRRQLSARKGEIEALLSQRDHCPQRLRSEVHALKTKLESTEAENRSLQIERASMQLKAQTKHVEEHSRFLESSLVDSEKLLQALELGKTQIECCKKEIAELKEELENHKASALVSSNSVNLIVSREIAELKEELENQEVSALVSSDEIAELKEELEKQKASALVSSNLLKHQETSAMELSQRLSER